jgi:hypothetical protein
MFYRQCNDCNEQWELGTTSTCTCVKDEPYAFEASMYSNDRMKVDPVTGNVSIGTPQRTWVGLTKEDIVGLFPNAFLFNDCDYNTDKLVADVCRIEAKLKEKNT